MPYITAWTAEQAPLVRVIERPLFGIGYTDENVADRDHRGVLWTRNDFRPGTGKPLFKQVHPVRQRRAMLHLLCQVCGEPADQTEDGALWLLPDYREDWAGWPDGMANTDPPVCRPCAALSARVCPGLRKHGHVAFRAQSTVVGVYGTLYQAGYPFPIPTREATVRFGRPTMRWLQASRLVRTLHDSTFVNLF